MGSHQGAGPLARQGLLLLLLLLLPGVDAQTDTASASATPTAAVSDTTVMASFVTSSMTPADTAFATATPTATVSDTTVMASFVTSSMTSAAIEVSTVTSSASSSVDAGMSSTPPSTATPSDPCKNYTEISLTDERSTKANSSGGLCDSNLGQFWYRFVGPVNKDIPDNSQCSQGSCGTNFTVCLKDAGLPTVADREVSRTVCRNGQTQCLEEWQIGIKNCGDFRVYFLPPPNATDCPSAYCVGTQAKCPEGQCSETGYTPGCDVCPSDIVLEPNVSVSHETVAQGSEQVGAIVFSCKFDPSNASDLLYDVFWYVNNQQVVNFTGVAVDKLAQTQLKEEHWSNINLGMSVNCSVRAKYSYSNASSRHHYSSAFYAGLEVNTTSLTVNEGEKGVILVRSTVPVPYSSSPAGQKQGLVVYAFSTASSGTGPACKSLLRQNVGITQKEKCGVRLHISNYTEWVEMEVWGTVDNTYTGDRTSMLKIGAGEATPVVSGRRLWNGHVLDDVTVTIRNTDSVMYGRICKSFDDPHMVTADGKAWENQREGEFILYKHSSLPLAVHTKYRLFYSYGRWAPTLNCAVAIRAYSTLLVLDRCSNISIGSRTRPVNHVSYVGCDDGHLTITRSRYTFKVTMPTGTAVQFNVYPYYAPGIGSVSVYPSMEDYGSSQGLCGPVDTDRSNDFTLRNGTVTADDEEFANDWRARAEESLFVASPTVMSTPSTPAPTFCICESESDFAGSTSTCSLAYPLKRCPQDQSKGVNAFLQHCGKATTTSSRRRRDLSLSDLVSDGPSGWQEPAVDLGRGGRAARSRQKRNTATTAAPEWPGNWTEASARNHCEKAFNDSSGAGKLEEATGLSDTKNEYIDGCIKDIQLTGGTSFTDVTVEIFKETVLEAAQRNATLQESPAGKALLQDIQNNACPRDCLGRGNCTNGTCQCEPRYVGQDCAIDKSSPPQNPYIPRNGLCDTRQRACKSTPVLADNLPEDGEVFCKFARFDATAGGGEQQALSEAKTLAKPFMVGEVECPFPDSSSSSSPSSSRRRRRRETSSVQAPTAYRVSVSLDNQTFSAELVVMIFDSNCYSCDPGSSSCKVLPNEGCQAPPTSGLSTGEIVGIVIGVVLGVALIVGVVVLIVLKTRKPPEVDVHPKP